MNKIKNTVFLFLLAFAIYGNTLNHGYVLDDYIVITGNNFTNKGISGISEILKHDAFVGTYGESLQLNGGRYRPLSIVMFAFENELFGNNPFIGHLGNVILYGITGMLIYLLMLKLLPDKNRWMALIAASLFIAHPVHTEVVANIKSRDEILALLFLIITLIASLSSGAAALLASPVLFFLALLSKENAITFLAVIPLAMYFFTSKKLKTIALHIIPLLVVTGFYLFLRAKYAGMIGDRETLDIMDNPYVNATISEKYATISWTLGKYLLLLLFPHPLSSDYSYNAVPLINWTDPKAFVSLIVFAVLACYAAVRFNKKGIITFAIIYFAVTISIVSNIVFNVGVSMGERFIYMPSLGFCIGITAALAGLLKIGLQGDIKFTARRVIPVTVALLLFSFKTISRNMAWKSNFILYETDAQTVPQSARIRLYYGIELLNRYNSDKNEANLNKSINEMTASVKIAPSFHHAWFNLGVAFEQSGDFDNAISCYLKVLEMQPYHLKATRNLGIIYGKEKKDPKRSIFFFEKLLNSNYQEPDFFGNLGIAYAMNGDFEKALQAFRQAIALRPSHSNFYINMAAVFDNMGLSDSAQFYRSKAGALEMVK